ncbi:MAG: inorganic phosphate transporter [Anaerovoracaceae bacterium]|jgi:PiT family inorganic phosphate transporter
MAVALAEFTSLMGANPALLTIPLLTLGVIFVNGWTDAPNAIATCVATRSMRPRAAIAMATVFNFLGVTVMTYINATVAQTIYNMVDFSGESLNALIALGAALLAIIIWATAAWWFGIPTSESHALIAGVSGAAIALQGGISGINGSEWIKVITGLGFSTGMGFASGWFIVKTIETLCGGVDRRKTFGAFKNAQIFAAAGMAFMHGAQDGQKFIGIFMLAIILAQGQPISTEFEIPLWLMILCSLIMALGTSVGGYRIIKSVGMNMVKLEKYQGFSADFAAGLCLLVSSVFGWPVSTTHTKTTAIMGVGAAKGIHHVNWRIVREMVTAWVLTFPGCGLIGFFMALIFLNLFV